MNKASGSDGILAELFQILKDDAVKMQHSICQQIWKTQQWPQDWKRSVFISIPPQKAMPNNAQTTVQLHSSHIQVKSCSKVSKPGFNNTWTENFQMFKLDLEKAKEQQIANISWIIEKARRFQRNICFSFIDYVKAFDRVDHNKLWKILKEMGIPDHLNLRPEKSVRRSRSNS